MAALKSIFPGRASLSGNIDDDGKQAIARDDRAETFAMLDAFLLDGDARARSHEHAKPRGGAFDVVRLRDRDDPFDVLARIARIREHARREGERATIWNRNFKLRKRGARAHGHVVPLLFRRAMRRAFRRWHRDRSQRVSSRATFYRKIQRAAHDGGTDARRVHLIGVGPCKESVLAQSRR